MPELSVSRKAIGEMFSAMQGHQFLIPEFQRPYKWNIDKCEALWDDIVNFSTSSSKASDVYYLGTIVSCFNKENKEIIDGQQRITSLLLLLRAFYKKLEDMGGTPQVTGLKNQIAPCIWDVNTISNEVEDKKKIHIKSLVVTEEDNDVLNSIIIEGKAEGKAKDNYSKNYLFFKRKCDEYAEKEPLKWQNLCVDILKRCVIFPIECDNLNTALTIFTTLNDRGLPLADSDIFKAQLYKLCGNKPDKKAFTDAWRELTDTCNKAELSINDIFRFYSHYIRAKAGTKSREVGLRSFYTDSKFKFLKEPNLLEDITLLATFWRHVKLRTTPDKEDGYSLSFECRKYLHCLSLYPNDYWIYIVSVFFLSNRKSKNFSRDFAALLKRVTALFFFTFLQTPTVNAIKDDTYTAYCAVYSKEKINISKKYSKAKLGEIFEEGIPSGLIRALLLLDAYSFESQKELIPEKFDIEHIFPKKWQTTNYNGWSQEAAEEYLDDIGNLVVFEKKLNIQAGNGYFKNKKEKYGASAIACVKELGKYKRDDWVASDIVKRREAIISKLNAFFTENL